VSRIREHCTGKAAQEYWKEKGKLGTAECNEVDWESLGMAMQEQDSEKRRTITKQTTGWCGVNKNMVRWNFETVHECPRCGHPQEIAKHVWLCSAESARSIWEDKEKALIGWMKRRKTHPEIIKVISSWIRCWRAGTRHASMHRLRLHGLREVVRAQDALGWDAAFEGKWHKGWAEIQQQYYSHLGMRRTGRRWMISIITKLFDVSWDLWMDRNGVNARLKEQRDRLHLETRVSEEFELGFQALHLRSRRLFTDKTEEARLILSDQAVESWLLRVESARRWAEMDPLQVQRDVEELARREELQQRREAVRRNREHMQDVMVSWLQGDQQA
jgi:ribosomal protein S14